MFEIRVRVLLALLAVAGVVLTTRLIDMQIVHADSYREQAENAMFMRETERFDSHPCLADRVRNLADVEAKELTADRPATTLFGAWSDLEEQMTREMIVIGRVIYELYIQELDREARLG